MAFGDKMRIRVKQVRKGQNDRKIRVAKAIHSTLVFATPIDTGRARAGWRATLGGTFTRSFAVNTNWQSQLALNQARISKALPEQQIRIGNNVPYLPLLNEGRSPQAPPQFVEMAVAIGSRLAPRVDVFQTVRLAP
jgi:hypothetical protein